MPTAILPLPPLRLMSSRWHKYGYIAGTVLFGALALLFLCVAALSFSRNFVDMWLTLGTDLRIAGNYVGLVFGFFMYVVFLFFTVVPRVRHNLVWFMKFTHELTHTLIALVFGGKIREFVVKDRECYVSYLTGPVGYLPITLSPYCIPVYTFMLFPFRLWGDNHYMIIFDAMIAFTYAFHLHSFVRYTRFSQPDIVNCGVERSVAFISFVQLCVFSLIVAVPKGGVMNALCRVFWEYPFEILSKFF